MDIKNVIRRKREKDSPELAFFEAVKEMKREAREFFDSESKKQQRENIALIKEIVSESFEKLETTLSAKIPNYNTLLENVKGNKGDAGHSPTDEELLVLIRPLIPSVKDGHTPTPEELLVLIRPLIPRVKDGETPSDERIIRLIKPLIPRVKDGETPSDSRLLKLIKPLVPTKEKLLALIRPLIESFEEKFNKKLELLSKNLRNLVRQKGGGASSGGGMGNLQHESTATSSATTTVTTNSRIAGGGFAIWAYYNGQLIMRGTHYTVGGDQKTLTLLFTPQDSTTVDIIYVRT